MTFDYTIRRAIPGADRTPVARVHNDYTEKSGPQRVRDLMGDEAEAPEAEAPEALVAQLDALFRVAHAPSFGTAVQALMVLGQLARLDVPTPPAASPSEPPGRNARLCYMTLL